MTLGFDERGINKETGTKYDKYGYDVNGYDAFGFDRNGYTKEGFNKEGYDRKGDGYNIFSKIIGSTFRKIRKETGISKFISYFLSDNCFIGYAGDIYNFGSLFGIESLDKNKVNNIDNYISQDGKIKKGAIINRYKYIVLDLPYGLQGNLQEKKVNLILDFINLLDSTGSLLIGLEPRLIELLQKKGCNISGIIEGERGDLPMSGIVPFVAIIQKNKANDLFLASTSGVSNAKIIYENFIKHESGKDLSEGVFTQYVYSLSVFNTYRADKKIENLDIKYKELDRYELGKLCEISEVSTGNITGEYIYVPKLGNMNVVGSLDDADKKSQNYLKLKVVSDIVTREYLLNYFKTEIAQISLQGCLAGTVIPKITKSSLSKLEIPVLKRDLQEKLNVAYMKLQNMKSSINEIEKRLGVSPWNVEEILTDLNEEKLAIISEGDKLRDLISGGESLTLEFKQTFFVDVRKKTEEQYIRKESLKNIAGFMNKEGGTLLIGVCDDQSIYGIENDNYKSDDEYLKRFKDIVKTSFDPSVLNTILFRIINIDGKKVLRVDCPKSDRLIYLKDEKDGAYVRTNPAVEKLTGQDLIDYSELRKKKS